jgi:predicted kinase
MDFSRIHALDIVLICGLPGAGKSWFARAHFQGSGRKRVNRKEIRRGLYEMKTFGERWSEDKFDQVDEHLVKHVEKKIVEHLLQNRQKVLIDNTSVTVASRKTYVALARQMHHSIGVVFLNCPASTCLARNRTREDAIPETAISKLAAALELPSLQEGFAECLVLNDTGVS